MALSDFQIESVHTWRHHDAAFVVLLGHACGWTIQVNKSGGVRMFSQDGTQVTVPDNTSLNINVFRSWVSKVWRHRRTTVSPTRFENIVGESKIDRPHVKIAWEATGLDSPTPLPERTPEQEAAGRAAADLAASLVDRPRQVDAETLTGEKIPYEAPAIESRVPTGSDARSMQVLERTMYPPADGNRHGKLVRQGPNQYKKTAKSKAIATSEHVIKREWSDGYIDFACGDCGHVSATPSGIGGHRVTHGDPKAKAAKALETKRRNLEEGRAEVLLERDERKKERDRLRKKEERDKTRKIPYKSKIEAEAEIIAEHGYTPVIEVVKTDEPGVVGSKVMPPPIDTPEGRLGQIARLVYPSMMEELETLADERDAAIARAEKAEGDLDALRDLLGVRK